jgi:hypothetical protein
MRIAPELRSNGPVSDAREIDVPLAAKPRLKSGEDVEGGAAPRGLPGGVICQRMCEGSQIVMIGNAINMEIRNRSNM